MPTDLTCYRPLVIQSVTWNLDVQYPYPFDALLGVLSIFSFDFLSTACMFKSSNLLSEVYFWSSVPVILSGLILFSYVTYAGRPGSDVEDLRSRHVYYALLLSYLTLPSVSLKQFQVSRDDPTNSNHLTIIDAHDDAGDGLRFNCGGSLLESRHRSYVRFS